MRRPGDAVPAPVWCDPAASALRPTFAWENGEADSKNFSCLFSSLVVLGPGAGQLNVPAAVERLDSIRKCHFFLCSCHDPGQHAAMEEAAAAAAAASRRASGTPGGQAARRSQIARADILFLIWNQR